MGIVFLSVETLRSMKVHQFVSWFEFTNWSEISQTFLSNSQTGGFAHRTEHRLYNSMVLELGINK
jgi:hypothetical protein